MRSNRAFTLIELLVVIAIIGILATLVVTQVSSARVRARDAQAKTAVSSAGKAIETYTTSVNEGFLLSSGTAAGAAYSMTGTVVGAGSNQTILSGIFTGVESSTTYGVRLSSTPSGDYTFQYVATHASVAAGAAAASTGTQGNEDLVSPVDTTYDYTFCSTVRSTGSANPGYYYVANGSTYDRTTAAVDCAAAD